MIERRAFVSVIVPTYRDWERLRRCLDALERQTYPKDRFEVVVVNNDPDGSVPDLPNSSNVRMLTEPRPGSYAARNTAIHNARGEVLAFTDSDCIPDKDWLANGAAWLEMGHRRVAGHIELFFSGRKRTIAEAYERATAFNQRAMAARGSARTANMIALRSVFDAVGLFNEKLFSGGDTEWGLRAAAEGIGIVYARDAVVFHPARATLGSLFAKARRLSGSIGTMKRYGMSRRWLVRGFNPPVRKMKRIIHSDLLTRKEKSFACLLAYAIKLYQTVFRIFVSVGLISPPRQ
ncbi:MAG: glycosyltransferase family 2 protein [Spirochaetales bacterium]